MNALAKDRRGYPIPFIVFRDTDGCPHFTINNSSLQRRCLKEKRCPICGSKLGRELWSAGGPLSAFHEHGCYMDTAMHYECLEYAMQVCPYLAMPQYLKRLDAATLDPAKCPGLPIFLDETQDPERPAVFVAVMSRSQIVTEHGYVRPVRPYVAMEYWRDGLKLSNEEGARLANEALQKAEATAV